MHEDAADGRFVGGEGQLGHLDGFAHVGLVVGAVGDGAEDHAGEGLAGGVGGVCLHYLESKAVVGVIVSEEDGKIGIGC